MKKTTVSIKQSNNVLKTTWQIIEEELAEDEDVNLHLFVNSVVFISRVIKKLKLIPGDVRIICSKNKNQILTETKTNQQKLGKKYLIEDTLSPVKRVNFYTSTAFEGCDIYDVNGKTFIISDGYNKNTLIDIKTLLIQICGRIRNSKYKDSITHIFSNSKYDSAMTIDEYENNAMANYHEVEKRLDELNGLSYESRMIMVNG